MRLSPRVGGSSHRRAWSRGIGARQLRAEGRDIVDLTAGEPDFDTPPHIAAAVRDALARGETRYTPVNGTLSLRQAIIAKLARENGVAYALENIVVGGGAKQVIYNALAATLDVGDEVIIPAPYWVSYPDMVAACDGTPIIVACGEKAVSNLQPRPSRRRSPHERAGSSSIRPVIPPAPSTPRPRYEHLRTYCSSTRMSR